MVKHIFRKDKDRYTQRWCGVAAEYCMENISSVLSNVELINDSVITQGNKQLLWPARNSILTLAMLGNLMWREGSD